ERHRERLLLTVTPHRQFRGRAGGHAADLLGEISGVFHRGAVDRSDDVAGLDARLRGRTIRLRLGDQRALRRLQTKIVGDLRSDGLDLHADPAAGDLTAVLELCDDRLHRRSGDRKGDTYRTAGRRKDGSIDADHVTVDIEGRATRIAFVDRSIDLIEVAVGTASDTPTRGRDDAGRYRAAEAERIAYRQHPVADARRLVRELDVGEVAAALDLDQRDVGTRIGTDHLGRVGLAVVGRHLDCVGLVDHVVVGHREAVGADEEAGALASDEMLTRIATLLGNSSIGEAEATEETLHL